MITARRESSVYASLKDDRADVSNVAVETATKGYERKQSRQETIDEVKARMKKNLDMILNYDKPEVLAAIAEDEKPVEVVDEVREDDIRPTTTTMQFGDGDVNQMFNELKKEETKTAAVSGKTKFAIVLYAIAITVILALIIINTGVLSLVNNKTELKQAELVNAMSEYSEISDELALHGDDYVASVAEDMGMIK